MSIELTILLTICGTVFGIVVGYLNWRRISNEDIKKEAISDGELKANILYIRQGVEDIKVDMRVQQKRTDELTERVVRVEESTKQAHKRIDEIQK